MTWEWESFGFAILSFIVLYWLLNRYAFGPLFSIMEKRRKLVLDELHTAEENRKQSEQYITEQKLAVENARKEAYEIIEQSRVTSSKQAEDLLEKAKQESARIRESALKDIEVEKNKAVAALRSQVSAMSVMIASKIIEKQIDEKTQQELIEHYLAEVGDKL